MTNDAPPVEWADRLAAPVECESCGRWSWMDRPCIYCTSETAGSCKELAWFSGATVDRAVGFAYRACGDDGHDDIDVLAVVNEWTPSMGDKINVLVRVGRVKGGEQ